MKVDWGKKKDYGLDCKSSGKGVDAHVYMYVPELWSHLSLIIYTGEKCINLKK